MAEEMNVETTETKVEESTQDSAKQGESSPTVDELLAQLALAKAESAKLKSANDKLSKESAEYKRQQRATMTAEEQKNAEIEEKIKALTERAELAEKENNHNKAVAAYKNLSDETTIEQLIDAISDADHNAIASIISAEKQKAVKEAQAEWLKSRPQISSGTGTAMTREQILAISDTAERQRAIAQNLELFTNK